MPRVDGGRWNLVAKPLLFTALIAIWALAAAPPAEAAKKRDLLTISPARPVDSKALKVAWRPTYDWPAKGLIYQFEISTGDGETCARSATRVIAGPWLAGDVLRATLRPIGGVWCSGRTVVRLRSAKNGGALPMKAVTLASRNVTIRDDPATRAPGTGPSNGLFLGEPVATPVDLATQPGSLLTVRVPGRPDRSATLGGLMRGYIPGRFVLNTDFISNFGVSGLRLSPLPADPLCSAAPVPDLLALPGTVPTQMTHLTKARTMRMALVLAQDPVTLTGCQGPLPAKPRTVLLEGRLGASGLANFELNGSLSGLRLSEGVDAEIVLKLVVKLDVVT